MSTLEKAPPAPPPDVEDDPGLMRALEGPRNLHDVSDKERQKISDQHYLGIAERVRSLNSVPYEIAEDSAQIDVAMRVVIHCCLSVNPFAAGSEAGAARKEIAAQIGDETCVRRNAEAEARNVVLAASMLGTHTAKVPDPLVSTGASLNVTTAARGKHPFVSSSTVTLRQTLGASGNAGQGRGMRFLATKLTFKGKTSTIAELLVSEPDVYAAAERYFGSKVMADLHAALTNKFTSNNIQRIDNKTKVVLWPRTDGSYLQISPVRASGLDIEKTARVRQRKSGPNWLQTKYLRIGGTKPQNAGLVPSDLAGNDVRIKADAPTLRSRSDDAVLLRRLGFNKSVFRIARPDDQAIEHFDRLAAAAKTNIDIRDGMKRAALAAVDPAFREADRVRHMLQNEEFEQKLSKLLSAAELRFLSPRRGNDLTVDETREICTKLARVITSVSTTPRDDDVDRLIVSALEPAVRSF